MGCKSTEICWMYNHTQHHRPLTGLWKCWDKFRITVYFKSFVFFPFCKLLRMSQYVQINVISFLSLPFSLSILSRLSAASSASLAEVLTPSPDFCVFSMMAHARSTNAGTVSAFSCRGISTNDQYWVSSRITSWNVKILNWSGTYNG